MNIAFQRFVQRFGLVAAAALLLTAFNTGTAHAWLDICNFSSQDTWSVITFSNSTCQSACGDATDVKGWFFIARGQCSRVHNGSMARTPFQTYSMWQDGRQVGGGGAATSLTVWWQAFDFCRCSEPSAWIAKCSAGSCPQRRTVSGVWHSTSFSDITVRLRDP